MALPKVRMPSSTASTLCALGTLLWIAPIHAGEIELISEDSDLELAEHPVFALDPAGDHLYSNGSGIVAPAPLKLSARSSITGRLGLKSTTAPTVDNLTFLTLRPDGAFAYATDTLCRVRVLSRNSSDGDLSLVQTIVGTCGGHLIVSPDGLDLYVLAEALDELHAFRIDPPTGLLTANGTLAIALASDGLSDGANDIASSPSGEHVYVATDVGELHVFARSAATGLLTSVEVESEGGEHLVVSPDGAHVYVASDSDTLTQWDRDPVTGELSNAVDFPDASVANVEDVEITPNGERVITFGNGPISVWGRDPATGIVGPTPLGGYAAAVDATAGELAISGDGRHLYLWRDQGLAGFLETASFALRRLEHVETLVDSGGPSVLASVRRVGLSPGDEHVYTVSDGFDTLAVFSRDASNEGALSFVETHVDGVGGVDGLDFAADVTVSPDGAHVYVAGLQDDGIAIFDRDAATGALTWIGALIQGNGMPLDGVSTLVVSPDGEHVYAAGFTATVALDRDPNTGLLSFVNSVPGSLFSRVAISTDGNSVYSVSGMQLGNGADRLLAMDRNPTTGALALLQTFDDGVGGVDGLDRARDVIVSASGELVVVSARDDDSLAFFSRAPATGLLTFEFASGLGVPGSPESIAIAPTGDVIAIAGSGVDQLSLIAFDETTLSRAPLQVETDGVSGIDGLDEVIDVAWSADGFNLYVAARTDGALSTWVPEPGLALPLALGALLLASLSRSRRRSGPDDTVEATKEELFFRVRS